MVSLDGAQLASPVVAVTGASGFIGSHVVDALLADGFRVRCCVRDPANEAKTAHLRALAEKRGGAVEFARGDLVEAGSFDDAFDSVDAVVHVAAVVEILKVDDPIKDIVEPSLQGCENVMSSVAKHRATIKKVVHTSSCIAVAAVNERPEEVYDEAATNEWSTVERDPYGFAKTSAEKLVREKCAALDVPLATINPGVTLGPCFTKAHTKSSTVLLRELLYGNPMLNYYASFVDVRDVAKAHAAALGTKARGRFLVVGDEGPLYTLDLGDIATLACPRWKLVATPKYGPVAVAALSTIYGIPTVGPTVAGWFGVTELGLCVFSEHIRFSNKRAKESLGISFRPLADTVREGLHSLVDGGWVKPRAA